MRNSSQLEVRWFSLAAHRRPVTIQLSMDHQASRVIPWFTPPSTASIPPLQDSNDAFAFKDALDSSTDRSSPRGGFGLPVEFALLCTDERKVQAS